MPQTWRATIATILALEMLLAGCVTPASAQEPERLVWRVMDFPPVWILNGPERGTGGGDLLQALLEQKMPGFRHERVESNLLRFIALAEQGEPVCTCALIKTPQREAKLEFGRIPTGISLGAGILTTREKRNLFGTSSTVSLAQTLANEQLKGGLAAGRSYGSAIDALLAQHENDPRLVRRPASDLPEGMFHLLIQGRLDFLVTQDLELSWLLHLTPIAEAQQRLVFVPVEESPPYLTSYIACPKTSWGRQMLARIDAVLAQEVFKESYRPISDRWTSDRPRLHRFYEEVFLKEARASAASLPPQAQTAAP